MLYRFDYFDEGWYLPASDEEVEVKGGGEPEAQLLNQFEASGKEYWIASAGYEEAHLAFTNKLEATDEFEQIEKQAGIYQERSDQSPKDRLLYTPEVYWQGNPIEVELVQDLREELEAAQPPTLSADPVQAREELWVRLNQATIEYLEPDKPYYQDQLPAINKKTALMIELYHSNGLAFPDTALEEYSGSHHNGGNKDEVSMAQMAHEYYPIQAKDYQENHQVAYLRGGQNLTRQEYAQAEAFEERQDEAKEFKWIGETLERIF